MKYMTVIVTALFKNSPKCYIPFSKMRQTYTAGLERCLKHTSKKENQSHNAEAILYTDTIKFQKYLFQSKLDVLLLSNLLYLLFFLKHISLLK